MTSLGRTPLRGLEHCRIRTEDIAAAAASGKAAIELKLDSRRESAEPAVFDVVAIQQAFRDKHRVWKGHRADGSGGVDRAKMVEVSLPTSVGEIAEVLAGLQKRSGRFLPNMFSNESAVAVYANAQGEQKAFVVLGDTLGVQVPASLSGPAGDFWKRVVLGGHSHPSKDATASPGDRQTFAAARNHSGQAWSVIVDRAGHLEIASATQDLPITPERLRHWRLDDLFVEVPKQP